MLHTQGIVIRTIKYGETSIIADIFTEEKGLCTFIGGSVRTARSRMPFSLFQPMTVIDMVSYWKDDTSALHRLKECKAGRVWTGIPFDLRKGAVALFIAEVMRKCLHEGNNNEALYGDLLDILQFLDATTGPVSNIHLHFLVHLAGHLGFQPQVDTPKSMPFFDLKEGEVVAQTPLHGQYMTAQETVNLTAFCNTPLEEAALLQMPYADRKTLLTKLLLYYQLHVPGFDEIHTPAVLEMVMQHEK
jgi:DNA repair protein RecO (recombination protein O)